VQFGKYPFFVARPPRRGSPRLQVDRPTGAVAVTAIKVVIQIPGALTTNRTLDRQRSS
jgi:hypothetical protein